MQTTVKILTVFFTLALLTSVNAVDRGTSYTQSQLDALTENDIRSTIEFVDVESKLTESHFFLNYGFHTIEKRDRDYLVEKRVMTVTFTVKEIVDCLLESNALVCVSDFINPRIEAKAIGLRDSRTKEILEWQSPRTFNPNNFENLLEAGELN